MAPSEAMPGTVFVKLGGSLITDKTAVEAVRPKVLQRLAAELREALKARPDRRLVLGHGSGSFGHVAAAKHGTRAGVRTEQDWRGFVEVSDAAARLNAIVRQALLSADLPAVTLQPSSSAICEDGQIEALAIEPLKAALAAGLLPLVYGDVAFDLSWGGTIISTEEILAALVPDFQPEWLLLAGETAGVYDEKNRLIPVITPSTVADFASALRGSRGTDVTGGMLGKVQSMLDLTMRFLRLRIRILSGLVPGELQKALTAPEQAAGTLITGS